MDGAADVLTDILRYIHISSAVFLRGDFKEPWAFRSCTAEELAAVLDLQAPHPILFHIVQEGKCYIRLQSGETATAEAGEAFVLPYSSVHSMGWPRETEPAPIETLLPAPPWPSLPTIRHGGNGPPTRILCGYMLCAEMLFNPILHALPALIHVRPRSAELRELLRAGLNFALASSHGNGPPGLHAESRLPELLLIECLRQYADTLPGTASGMLAALRDPLVANAVGMLHAESARQWSVRELSRESGASRAVLAHRFKSVLGQSPMRYLTNWRLQLAVKLLSSTRLPVSEIAFRVGFRSEAAFSRAFKRRLGSAPSTWRAAACATGRPKRNPPAKSEASTKETPDGVPA